MSLFLLSLFILLYSIALLFHFSESTTFYIKFSATLLDIAGLILLLVEIEGPI